LAYFSINQPQFGARIIGFSRGQFSAEVIEGGVVARGAQAMDLDRQRFVCASGMRLASVLKI
jgi:hypothetical protein